jgi:hypothetical protein
VARDVRTSLRQWRHRILALCVLGLGTCSIIGWAGSTAGASPPVAFSAVVSGQPVLLSTDAHPAQIYPSQPTPIRITVKNNGAATLHVATVRFQGEVMNLPLFSYNTAVGLVIPAGQTKSLRFDVNTTGVGSQATGLVGSTITLLDPHGAPLASHSVTVRVHGELRSLYGLFGLAVLFLTASSFVFALLALIRHTLPANRWLRGVRFLIPGFGFGLVLIFTFSALDIFTPGTGHWLPLLIATSATGFALGYLTPAPDGEVFDDYDDDVMLAQIIVVDDDPLEAAAPPEVVTTAAPAGAPDGRATTAPADAPDGRATMAP